MKNYITILFIVVVVFLSGCSSKETKLVSEECDAFKNKPSQQASCLQQIHKPLDSIRVLKGVENAQRLRIEAIRQIVTKSKTVDQDLAIIQTEKLAKKDEVSTASELFGEYKEEKALKFQVISAFPDLFTQTEIQSVANEAIESILTIASQSYDDRKDLRYGIQALSIYNKVALNNDKVKASIAYRIISSVESKYFVFNSVAEANEVETLLIDNNLSTEENQKALKEGILTSGFKFSDCEDYPVKDSYNIAADFYQKAGNIEQAEILRSIKPGAKCKQ